MQNLDLQLPLTGWFGEDEPRRERAVALVIGNRRGGAQLVSLIRGLETGSDKGAKRGQEYLFVQRDRGGAIHAESEIWVHAGGQLAFGSRFGFGAGAANVLGAGGGPGGGGEDGAEDDGEIDQIGVGPDPLGGGGGVGRSKLSQQPARRSRRWAPGSASAAVIRLVVPTARTWVGPPVVCGSVAVHLGVGGGC
jgi:hypothetical protein